VPHWDNARRAASHAAPRIHRAGATVEKADLTDLPDILKAAEALGHYGLAERL
jgi:hypothetical protein